MCNLGLRTKNYQDYNQDFYRLFFKLLYLYCKICIFYNWAYSVVFIKIDQVHIHLGYHSIFFMQKNKLKHNKSRAGWWKILQKLSNPLLETHQGRRLPSARFSMSLDLKKYESDQKGHKLIYLAIKVKKVAIYSVVFKKKVASFHNLCEGLHLPILFHPQHE